MTRAPTIARRELGSYFYSPVAYVAMTLFLLACAFAFWADFQPGQPAEMRNLFQFMVPLLVFIVPILSMGLLSQEWAAGTIEPLMTAPLGEGDVVVGKFLGSLTFFLVLLAPTLVYALLLMLYARPDGGAIFSGYLGIVLVGALFTAIGLFCSSLTRSQVVAAVMSAAALFLVTIVPWYVGGQTAVSGFWRGVVDQCVYRRYADFGKGVIDTGNVVFFVATTLVFLFLTTKVLESRRWK